MFERKHISIFKFYCHLFEPLDYLFLILGLIGLIIYGLSHSILPYINANVYSSLGDTSESRENSVVEEIMKQNVREVMNSNIKKQLIYGSVTLVGNTMGYFFLGLISSRCLYNFKKKYFTVLLSQEQAWFDSANIFEFATKIQTQIEYIERGMGENLMFIIIDSFIGITSFIFAFFGSWKLSLVLLCLFPICIYVNMRKNKKNLKGNTIARKIWESAGGIAEEIFYNIKTVVSFSNFDYELKRFYEKVEISYRIEILTNLKVRLYTGIQYFITSLIIFIAFIYGRTFVKKDFNSFRGRDITGGDITLSYNCIISFYKAFIRIFISLEYVQVSLAATSDYFSLYERKPNMDLTNSIEKPPLDNIKGKIEFKNVNFYYPTDINKRLILDGINLNFEAGKKVAIIGQTGCGKTTIINLIERLYEITDGEILLDGLDIRRYDIQYLRHLIGYVEQEPILFDKTIRQNIIFGREKYIKELGEDIEQSIKKVCDEAYASEFIEKLPNGLDYVVGLKGSKLSGGQKQRIAIARALLIKPKILILDEATSALDNKSEKIVQKALDNISKMNITTIIIAHRLSTIKNADIIYALKDGKVYEQGTHEELLKKGGYYANTIKSQLVLDSIKKHNERDKYIKRMTTVNAVKTGKIKFKNYDKEISKSPEDVHITFCTILKDLWLFKFDFFLGLISSILIGVINPFIGLIFGKCINSINSLYETIRFDDTLKYSIILFILSILDGLFNFICFWKLINLGLKLARYYRKEMMKKFLSFHLSYYDEEKNTPGAILTKMSINTIQLKDYTRDILGSLIICISLFITTLILCCCYEYRLTLITIIFIPVLIFINIMRKMLMQSDNKKSMQVNLESGAIISGCLTNTKTIFVYNFKNEAIKMYLEAIDYITQKQTRDNIINGLGIGLSYSIDYCRNACFYAATKRFVLNNTLETGDMYIIQSIIGKSTERVISYVTKFGRIKKAVFTSKSLYSIFETQSLIPPYEKDNINKLTTKNIKGKIEFKNVYFSYPTNYERAVLKDINMTIEPGQKIALVGYSGCGKSSIIQLINRFYDIDDDKGEILIDGVNIKDYNIYELRKRIGYISQEPSIFKTSNMENIRYGNLDATDEECIEAAKKANSLNILQYDEDNKQLIDKKVHKKKLSGGEKQKLAIARILIKKPIILLFDEVTSALDKNSELEVQKTLDNLSMNITTITIAHRLNTIKDYDKIYVFDNGRIKEQGTHEELMKLKKRYYTLYNN